MIAFNNLPDNIKVDQFFGTTSSQFLTWTKPIGCNFIHIIACGAGGGGANGTTGAAGTLRSGGGGGGAGILITALFPAFYIPDTLYLLIGKGGIGGSGVAGGNTIISLYASTFNVATNLIFAQGGPSPAGSTSSAPSYNATNNPFISYSVNSRFTLAGTNGSTTTSAASSVTWANNISGGAGGGSVVAANTSSAGGGITTFFNNVASGTILQGGTSGGGNGNDGFALTTKKFGYVGGSGGGGNENGVGGKGGNGSFGCGGGGGGGGLTGGAGGNGGDGFAIIISY